VKFRTVIEREGELLGPVDWAYNFRQHFDGYCCSDEKRDEFCNRAMELLRKVEASPDAYCVQISHSDNFREVYAVGMYDGWPYWRPVPALLCRSVLGSEWQFFYDLLRIEARTLQSTATERTEGSVKEVVDPPK